MAEPRARVLLVEDTASLAAVYSEYLAAAGYAAEHARNAEPPPLVVSGAGRRAPVSAPFRDLP